MKVFVVVEGWVSKFVCVSEREAKVAVAALAMDRTHGRGSVWESRFEEELRNYRINEHELQSETIPQELFVIVGTCGECSLYFSDEEEANSVCYSKVNGEYDDFGVNKVPFLPPVE